MFGRINSSHTLNQAVLLKANNEDISDKTLSKISQKLKSIHQKVMIETPLNPNDKGLIRAFKEINQINDSLQKIKSDKVYEKISRLVNESLGNKVVDISVADALRVMNRAPSNGGVSKNLAA